MIISLVIVITVLLGAILAVLALIRIALRHERERWLSNEAPTRIAAAARTISGLYVQMPQRDPYVDHFHDSPTGRTQQSRHQSRRDPSELR